MIREKLHWYADAVTEFVNASTDDLAVATTQYVQSENMDVAMIRAVACLPQVRQRYAEYNQTLVRPQLDRQIDQEHPIRATRQGTTQKKQADAQQPQTNGFGTRANGSHRAPE